MAARLPGRRVCWGVAMDNAVDLPGYKCYLAGDGSRPDVCVAFLDVVADARDEVRGLCVPVADGVLPALDARERNYERVEVTVASADGDTGGPRADGTVWAYAGRADSRARFQAAVRDGRCVIARAYLEAVRAGLAAALGDEAAARVDDATRRSGLPVVDLRRVDLP